MKRRKENDSDSILEDAIEEEIMIAKIEAELVKRLGPKWFRQVAEWSWRCLLEDAKKPKYIQELNRKADEIARKLTEHDY